MKIGTGTKCLLALFLMIVATGPIIAGVGDCPLGYSWCRTCGVNCIQTDCPAERHMHYNDVGYCICASQDYIDDPKEDKFSKACRKPANDPTCPGCLEACILPQELCPSEKLSAPYTGQDDVIEKPEKKTDVVDITKIGSSLSKEDDGIDSASKELNDVVAHIKKLKDGDHDDHYIALIVNQIVKNRIDPINNFWVSPISWLKDRLLGSYKNIDEWRAFKASDYDTIAIWTWNNRVGQCEEIAATVYYIMKNAGMNVDIYTQTPPGDHAFVILNMAKKNSLSDSRTWIDYVDTPVVIVDTWQHRTWTKEDAYDNKRIMNGGKIRIANQHYYYTPKQGYEDIKKRNIVWDKDKKQWRCRTDYKQKIVIDNNGKEKFLGYCIK